jgi:hypothetical protein
METHTQVHDDLVEHLAAIWPLVSNFIYFILYFCNVCFELVFAFWTIHLFV